MKLLSGPSSPQKEKKTFRLFFVKLEAQIILLLLFETISGLYNSKVLIQCNK